MPVQATLTQASSVLLRFDEISEIEGYFETAWEQSGFLLELPRELKLYTQVPFEIASQNGLDFSFEATVIQSFPAGAGFRTAFQLVQWNQSKQMELARKLRTAKTAPAAGTAAGASAGSATGARPPGAASRPGESPAFRIRAMNVSERMRLASKAGRVERQVLLRDHSPQVLMGLLNNPRIEDKDILALVKSTHANGAIMERVARNRRWAANLEVKTAIVRNAKTPTPLAIRLLDGLRTPDLGALAKAGSTREGIRRAALSLYLKRTQGR